MKTIIMGLNLTSILFATPIPISMLRRGCMLLCGPLTPQTTLRRGQGERKNIEVSLDPSCLQIQSVRLSHLVMDRYWQSSVPCDAAIVCSCPCSSCRCCNSKAVSLCQVYTRIRGEQREACKVRVLVATVVTMAIVNWILAVNMAVSITVSITVSVTVSITVSIKKHWCFNSLR